MALGLSRVIREELPHPPLSLAYVLIVEAAIEMAWQILREKPRPGFDLSSAVEDVVTQELCEVLCNEVFAKGLVEGFERDAFDVPDREPKVRNFNREHLDKMPDLLIRLVDRPDVALLDQDGLFIECKPVDADHTAGKHYCDRGLIRFVIGDYAWAMTEAMMIGYVNEGYRITPKLQDALRKRAEEITTLNFPTPCPESKAGPFGEPAHTSEHARTFRYVETDRQAPPVTIRHLWLRRD